MKIAVLSGKGGAGKTFTAVNLAVAAGQACYIDCDVEEPNGRLFFKPENIRRERVNSLLPDFDSEKCSGCRACVDFCRFHALVFIKSRPQVFAEVCHSCGGCALICPEGAVRERTRPVGWVETGQWGSVKVVSGVLDPGEASGAPVIKAALEKAEGLTVIDCPPGSACPVMESVAGADYCLLVAEPTAFGLHNLRMVHELSRLLGKPCGVVINKQLREYEPLERFCREEGLPVLLRLPYSGEIASACAEGQIMAAGKAELKAVFRELLDKIGGGLE